MTPDRCRPGEYTVGRPGEYTVADLVSTLLATCYWIIAAEDPL